MAKTFERFLAQYCRELSGLGTTGVRALARALPACPRLEEPLLLLALCRGREGYLLRSAAGLPQAARFAEWIGGFRRSGLGLEEYLSALPEGDRHRKCLASWRSDCSALERDRAVLAALRVRLAGLIDEKGLTRAEACRAAGLNKGNFYAFLKGDVTRLSRATAVRAYDAIAHLP